MKRFRLLIAARSITAIRAALPVVAATAGGRHPIACKANPAMATARPCLANLPLPQHSPLSSPPAHDGMRMHFHLPGNRCPLHPSSSKGTPA